MGDFKYEDAHQPLKHPVEKIPNKYQEYLMYSKIRNQKLQELNKLKPKNNKIIQLEEGFSLYFNGANSELTDRKEKTTAVAPRKSKTCEERGKTHYGRSKSGMDRPTWGSATKLGFLTERGDKLYVKPSNYYSEDFDEVEDVRNESENDDEIAEETSGISVDLSMNDLRCLRQSLVLSNSNKEDKGKTNLADIAEDEEKIMTLELKLDDKPKVNESMMDVSEIDCDNRLKEIIERVLKMNLDQQQKLLSTLEKIETTFENDPRDEIEVVLVIVQNWGHSSRVGLTEVEFLDRDKQPIRIRRVTSSGGVDGPLENIVNQKKDTSKEKHMWSTSFSNHESIRISFHIETLSMDDVKYLAVWNFNKSFDTLSMGVRKLCVQFKGKVLCEGVVDKALGNSAFNPPTILELRSDDNKQTQDSKMSFSPGDVSSDDECLMDKFQNTINANRNMSQRASVPNLGQMSTNLTFRTDFKGEEVKESLIDESSSRKGSARFGRRSEIENAEGRDQLKEIVAEFEMAAIDKGKPESLEKSWSSLMFFNKSQAGRLSLDYTGDILDQYVDQIRRDMDMKNDLEEEFVIPELPVGRELRLNILSTWGDPHYVGLTGIEMFTASGEHATVNNITADPCDINILPGYGSDPRVVKNLLDGVNKTRDDVHMWLAPFTPNRNHFVVIRFVDKIQLALLRIWNYNKSRIHSSRGAREVEITLDGTLIFKGEISRTSNSSNDAQEVGEVILFTSDDLILDQIGMNDQEFVEVAAAGDVEESNDRTNELLASLTMRPPTAKETLSGDTRNNKAPTKIEGPNRPFTCARPAQSAAESRRTVLVKLGLVETWGDKYYIGLTGIEFLLVDGTVVVVNSNNVSTNITPLESDTRVLANIFDGNNITTSDEHMWLAPFSGDQEHEVLIEVDTVSK